MGREPGRPPRAAVALRCVLACSLFPPSLLPCPCLSSPPLSLDRSVDSVWLCARGMISRAAAAAAAVFGLLVTARQVCLSLSFSGKKGVLSVHSISGLEEHPKHPPNDAANQTSCPDGRPPPRRFAAVVAVGIMNRLMALAIAVQIKLDWGVPPPHFLHPERTASRTFNLQKRLVPLSL